MTRNQKFVIFGVIGLMLLAACACVAVFVFSYVYLTPVNSIKSTDSDARIEEFLNSFDDEDINNNEDKEEDSKDEPATPSASNPVNSAKDTIRKDDIGNIAFGITLYSIDNSGKLPTVNGEEIPVITEANIMMLGAEASDLDDIAPEYLSEIPRDPSTGYSYRVGVTASGQILVGAKLSDGSTEVEKM